MSAEKINTTTMETIKEELLRNITNLIPTLIDQLLLDIIKIIKDKTAAYLEKHNNLFTATPSKTSVNVNLEYDQYRDRNYRFFDEKLTEREEKFYQLTKYENLLDLHGECMQQEPIYIPRKFRKDKFHVLSQKEKESVSKFELQRFRSECEILNIRKNTMISNIFDIDNDVENVIDKSDTSLACKEMLKKRWHTLINEDISRVNAKLEKKKSSTRKAFEKDWKEHANRNAESTTTHANTHFSEHPMKQSSTSTLPPNTPAVSTNVNDNINTESLSPMLNEENCEISKNSLKTPYEKPYLRSSTFQDVT